MLRDSSNIVDLRDSAMPIVITLVPWVAALVGCRMLVDNWRDATDAWLIIASLMFVMSWAG